MKTYDFDLILSAPTTEEEDELVFEHFEGRVSPSVTAGIGCLSVHFEAQSMEEAIQDAIRRAEEVGLTVERVEMEKKAFEVA
jgi:hypothetical protein